MFQNIINNWENLDQDCELLNLVKLMWQKQSNVCFNSSHLISTITVGTLQHCLTVQDSSQDFPMTWRSTTTKQLSLMRPSEDLHKKLYCLIDLLHLYLITECKAQARCTVMFSKYMSIGLTELSGSTFYH